MRRVAGGLIGLLVAAVWLQRPGERLRAVARAGGSTWLGDASLVVLPAFGAVFVVFMLASHAAIEDDTGDVSGRLLACPVSFPTVLAARTLPVAAWATVAAAVVGVGVWPTAPLAAWRVGLAVAVVGLCVLAYLAARTVDHERLVVR